MQGEEIFHPFDPTGLTPPKGRLGHSVPTPRVLSGEGHLLATNGPVKVLLHQFSGPNAAVRLSGTSMYKNFGQLIFLCM